jgi:hypothetical protein
MLIPYMKTFCFSNVLPYDNGLRVQLLDEAARCPDIVSSSFML